MKFDEQKNEIEIGGNGFHGYDQSTLYEILRLKNILKTNKQNYPSTSSCIRVCTWFEDLSLQ